MSQSQSGTPLPRQVKKLRRESDIGSTPQTQAGKPESRSERHKRVRKMNELFELCFYHFNTVLLSFPLRIY